jgi:hypothetical protein
VTPPLTPGRYLERRRIAAGLTRGAVAERLASDPRWPEHIRVEYLALIEEDKAPAAFSTIFALRRIFAFDISVLAKLDEIARGVIAADQAPAICPDCGCSWDDPCFDDDGQACSWAHPGTGVNHCTFCVAAAPQREDLPA